MQLSVLVKGGQSLQDEPWTKIVYFPFRVGNSSTFYELHADFHGGQNTQLDGFQVSGNGNLLYHNQLENWV